MKKISEIKENVFKHRYIKTKYQEEMAIFPTLWMKFWLIILLLFLAVLPAIANDYLIFIINSIAIAVISAIGLNFLVGYAGQISIGQAALMGIGAYTSAILYSDYGFPFLWSVLSGVIFAIVAGLIIAIPALRLRGLYLAIITIAFQFIIEYIIRNWRSVTGGRTGYSVDQLSIFGFSISSEKDFYLLIIPITIIIIYFSVNTARSKLGRIWGAIRDRDIAAEAIGINVTAYKILAFVFSAGYAGLAGALYGFNVGYIGAEHFGLLTSILYLAMVLVGGAGAVLGAIFGAIAMILLPEALRMVSNFVNNYIPIIGDRFMDLRMFLYGLIIIFIVLIAPEGLFGLWNDIKKYFRNWPFRY